MTQPATAANETKSPLNAALKIVAELHGMSPENQSLALQFATQELRLTPQTAHVAALPVPNSPHSPLGHAAPVAPGQPTDIKAFTAAKAPQSDQQFAAVVAYYYQFEARPSERKELIDAATMKEAARLAARPQVKRWETTLHNAARAGYLSLAGKASFKLSPVGENLVAITLPGTVWGGATNGGGSGKKSAKKKAKTKNQTKKPG